MWEVVFRQQARRDILGTIKWYKKERPTSAEPFSDAVDATVAAILENPYRYATVERQSRRALVSGFPYAIYYRIGEDAVVVLSCTHFSRHPRHRRAE